LQGGQIAVYTYTHWASEVRGKEQAHNAVRHVFQSLVETTLVTLLSLWLAVYAPLACDYHGMMLAAHPPQDQSPYANCAAPSDPPAQPDNSGSGSSHSHSPGHNHRSHNHDDSVDSAAHHASHSSARLSADLTTLLCGHRTASTTTIMNGLLAMLPTTLTLAGAPSLYGALSAAAVSPRLWLIAKPDQPPR
jgi:hypothetical protein